MSEFVVTTEPVGRTKSTSFRLLGLSQRQIAIGAAVYFIPAYHIMLGPFGPLVTPLEHFYSAGLALASFVCLPGLLVVALLRVVTGMAADFQAFVFSVLISAVVYGFEVQRVLKDRKRQTP